MPTTITRTIVRVLPAQGRWEVRCEKVASTFYELKEHAITAGRTTALLLQPSQLVIHLADGTIETEHTYGNDPYPPPG